MNEKVKAFYEVVSADDKLQEELVAVNEGVDLEDISEEEAHRAVAEAVVAFAASHDIDLTVEDIFAADAEAPEGEMADAELEGVVGGKCGCVVLGVLKGCGCFIGGGATHKGNWHNVFVCPFTVGFE